MLLEILLAASAVVSAGLLVYLFGMSIWKSPGLVTALVGAVAVTLIAAIGGSGLIGRLAAGLCLGFGVGVFALFSRYRARVSSTARFLRLLAAGCCAALGLLLLLFPFPPTSLSAQFAWMATGCAALGAYGVFLVRGQAHRESRSPLSAPEGSVPIVPALLDVSALLASLLVIAFYKIWPNVDGLWIVMAALVVLAAGLISMFVQHWILWKRKGGRPVMGTAWAGIAVVMLGFGLEGGSLATTQQKAAGLLVVGVGLGFQLWMMCVGPMLSGTPGIPQLMARWSRTLWK